MNTILLIIIGILLTVEFGMIMYCEYWRENNPWKWFVIKLLTTMSIVIYIVHDKELITMFDLIICAVLAACIRMVVIRVSRESYYARNIQRAL